MANDGGNDTLRGRVICPFYERHTSEKKAIVCEGLAKGAETAMLFSCRADMERYSGRYCETYQYGCCPLAKGLAQKYEDCDRKAGR